ncbi:hypothetical protein NDA13_005904 [Ustilago tritici]|nr:hypothetical protein NDA13_005904 [Ustilago tritici]
MAQHQSATSTSTLLAADKNGPTSSSKWVVSESAPWNTKGAKRLSVGHSIASSQIVKSYLSWHNVVDIQGLVQRGKESKNCIMLHNLHHVKAITDTLNSLHAVGIAVVESMPIIQQLVHEYNQGKVALSNASAQGLPAHKYQALKVDHNKKMKRLERAQCQLQCQTMIEHTYKEKEDLNICALLGSVLGGAGPAAAARELSQQLQAGGDTNGNDGSDQAGSSMMHQASTSCMPLGSHLDSHTSDQGNADPSYEWMHQATSIPFLSQAPLLFASTSTPSSSTADDPAHVSSPASGTSLSAKEPLSLLLCEKLNRLCNQIGSMIGDLPQPEYNLLKKDGASMPLCELFAAMTTNNVGTQNAVLATLEKQNGAMPSKNGVNKPAGSALWTRAFQQQQGHTASRSPMILLHIQASKSRKQRDNWISWVQSITPLPPPAAMLSIQSAAQEEINALMAQAVTDAKEQVAGQVGCSVLPILSTGATQEASPANLSRPVLLTGRHGRCSKPLVVHHACPFCAQDESLLAEQRSQVWNMSKFAHHVAGVHLFNMSSSPTTCPSCGEAMPIKELALCLDCRHELGLSGKKSEPLADDLSNLGGRTQAKQRPAFLRWIQQGYPNNNTSGRMSAKAVAISKQRSGSSRYHAVSTPSAPGQQQSGTSQTESSDIAIASGSKSYPEINLSVLLDNNFYKPPTQRVKSFCAPYATGIDIAQSKHRFKTVECLVAPPVYLQAASSVANLLMKMEVQVKDENGVAHIIDTSNIGGYQPDTISKVVTILACNINADYETVKHIGDLTIHANHVASYLAEACNNRENGLETQELKEPQTLQQAAFIGHRHSGYCKFRHYTKLNWESIFGTESPATPPLTAASASTIPVAALSSVVPEASAIATSLASVSHTSATPSSTVPATFTTPVATLSAPAAHSSVTTLSTTTSSLKPAELTASNGNSLATAKHSSATSPSITRAASTQPVAALSEPLKHSSAKSLSSAPAATLVNPVATSSVSAKHSSVTPSQKKKTRKQRADEMGWYSTWPMAVKEWHNDKQAELEDWKKDTDKEAEAHNKESERLGFAGLDLARKYVMEYGDGSSDDEPEAERDIDFGTKESNATQQGYLVKAREMLKTKGLHKTEEEDRAKVEKLLQQPDAEGKVVEEVDSNTNLYCNMPPGDVIVPIQAGTICTAESHDALGASQVPLMSYLQDTVEPPPKLPFAKTPNTNVMEHNNSQPTNKQDAAMPGSSGAVPTPDVTKKHKGKMCQVRDPSLSPPPSSNPQRPVVEVVIPEVGLSRSTNEAKGSQARSKRCTTAEAKSQMGSNREGSQAGIEFATANVAATAKKVGGMHVFKKTQNHARARKILAPRHCGLCERCLQVSIDCMPADSGSYKVKCNPCNGKSHPPFHHKFWLDQSLVTKAHCGNKFGEFEPLKNTFHWNKGEHGGAGYKEVAQHGTGQPATTTTPNTPSGSKQTAAEAGLVTSQMRSSLFRPGPSLLQGYRASPGRPVPLQSNINLAYRSVDIAKGSHAEAALKSISTAAKGLVERFGIHNHSKDQESKEEACLEALEDFADTVIDPQDLPWLRVLILSGEPTSLQFRKKWLAPNIKTKLFNLYGTTEGGIHQFCCRMTAEQLLTCVGHPLPGMRATILGRDQQPCPRGAVGHIWVDGPYLGQGYLDDAVTTGRYFKQLAYYGVERLTHAHDTGDLGYIDAEDNVQLVGRQDHQVKVRGQRVELGEVEAQISQVLAELQVGSTKSAVVLRSVPDLQEEVLVAFVKSEDEQVPVGTACPRAMLSLKESLHKKLPRYMVPTFFVPIETFPLTSSGKLDRKSLASMPWQSKDRRALPAASSSSLSVVSSANSAERYGTLEILLDTIGEVTGIHATPDTRLMEQGITSITAMRILAVLRTRHRLNAKINDFFEHPTIATIAASIEERQSYVAASSLVHSFVSEERPCTALSDRSATSKGSSARSEATLDAPHAIFGQATSFKKQPEGRYDVFPPTTLQESYLIGRRTGVDLSLASKTMIEVLLPGDFSVDRIRAAFRVLVQRHDALRLIFDTVSLQQTVLAFEEVADQIPVSIHDFISESLSYSEREDLLQSFRDDVESLAFDPSCWPLFDVSLATFPALKIDSRNTLHLWLSLDLLIIDAKSVQTLCAELRALLNFESEVISIDDPLKSSVASTTYRDYVVWHQNGSFDTDAYADAQAYWQEKLPTLQLAPALPMRSAGNHAIDSASVHHLAHTFSETFWSRFVSQCKQHSLLPSAVLMTNFIDALRLWSEEPYFTVNTTLFNREYVEDDIYKVIGDFTGGILFQTPDEAAVDDKSFSKRCRRVQKQLLSDISYSQYSSISVIRDLQCYHPGSLMPIVFTCVLPPGQSAEIPGPTIAADSLEFEVISRKTQTSQVWLDFQVFPSLDGSNIELHLDYMDVFEPQVAQELFGVFAKALERTMAPDTEYVATLKPGQTTWDEVHSLPDKNSLLTDGFIRSAEFTPERTAIEAVDGTLTYGKLARYAALGAGEIDQLQRVASNTTTVEPDNVAVLLDKSCSQLASVLAVLLSGNAYVPIDTETPPQRVAAIAAGAGITLVITSRTVDADKVACFDRVLYVEDFNPAACEDDSDICLSSLPLVRRRGDQLAYTIFTSGSTGRPKGVRISHHAALNTIASVIKRFGLLADDCCFGLSKLSFDLFVYDIFGTLSLGGKLALPH